MDEWYEELDFEENPFSTNPSDFVKNIVGRDEIIDELVYRIKAGTIMFLEGVRGNGKSSLLRYIIRKFRGKGKVIFVNCDKVEKALNVESLLIKKNGLIKGIFLKHKPKNMILLLDNVNKLSYKNMERIKYYFDENYLKSVVFTGENFEKVGFSKSLVQRIEGRIIKIPKMEAYQIIDLIRERIGDIKFFSDEIIEKISDVCDYNPKEVLKACEEVAEFVIGIDEDVVTEKHLEEVLGKKIKEESTKEELTEAEQKNYAPKQESVKKVVQDAVIKENLDPKDKGLDEENKILNEEKSGEKLKTADGYETFEGPLDDDETPQKKESSVEVIKESSKEEVSEDVISKPIISEESHENEDGKEKSKQKHDDDDFFADDFFDDFDEEEEVKEKKSKTDNEYDDFFDDDFDKSGDD